MNELNDTDNILEKEIESLGAKKINTTTLERDILLILSLYQRIFILFVMHSNSKYF